jgi:hypothetical protein
MQGAFKTPGHLALALLRGPVTPERIRKLLRHAKKGTHAEWVLLLDYLPPDVRPKVEAAGAGLFQG